LSAATPIYAPHELCIFAIDNAPDFAEGSAFGPHSFDARYKRQNLDWQAKNLVRNHRDINEICREVLGSNFPTRTMVQVAALARPELLLEINATAVIP
jgi:hypothetical protein